MNPLGIAVGMAIAKDDKSLEILSVIIISIIITGIVVILIQKIQ